MPFAPALGNLPRRGPPNRPDGFALNEKSILRATRGRRRHNESMTLCGRSAHRGRAPGNRLAGERCLVFVGSIRWIWPEGVAAVSASAGEPIAQWRASAFPASPF